MYHSHDVRNQLYVPITPLPKRRHDVCFDSAYKTNLCCSLTQHSLTTLGIEMPSFGGTPVLVRTTNFQSYLTPLCTDVWRHIALSDIIN